MCFIFSIYILNLARSQATDYSLVRDIRHIVEEYLVDGSLGVHDGFPVEWPCRNTTKETLRCTVSPGSSEGSQGSGSIKRGGNNSLKLTGERITGLVASFSERKSPFSVLSPQNSPRKSSLTSPSPSPTPAGKSLLLSPDKTVFDSIEQAVFTALKEKHWNAFMESEEWARYHQFMVMQEQMQRDGLKENKDFFVLRVVGRGGFGQVRLIFAPFWHNRL